MPDGSAFAVFAAGALVLLVIPGPAVLYVVSQAIDGGRRAGLVSVLGLHVGTTVHIAAAALGLSALLVSSALAFDVVKYAGAAYLVYLGVRRLLGRDGPIAAAGSPQRRPADRFRQGIVVEALNPKTALFCRFLAIQRYVTGVTLIALGAVAAVTGQRRT